MNLSKIVKTLERASRRLEKLAQDDTAFISGLIDAASSSVDPSAWLQDQINQATESFKENTRDLYAEVDRRRATYNAANPGNAGPYRPFSPLISDLTPQIKEHREAYNEQIRNARNAALMSAYLQSRGITISPEDVLKNRSLLNAGDALFQAANAVRVSNEPGTSGNAKRALGKMVERSKQRLKYSLQAVPGGVDDKRISTILEGLDEDLNMMASNLTPGAMGAVDVGGAVEAMYAKAKQQQAQQQAQQTQSAQPRQQPTTFESGFKTTPQPPQVAQSPQQSSPSYSTYSPSFGSQIPSHTDMPPPWYLGTADQNQQRQQAEGPILRPPAQAQQSEQSEAMTQADQERRRQMQQQARTPAEPPKRVEATAAATAGSQQPFATGGRQKTDNAVGKG